MTPWIFFPEGGADRSPQLDALAARLQERIPHLSEAAPADGGLRKRDLLDALSPRTLGEPMTNSDVRGFGAQVIDLVSASGMAISVQTGRAKNNNEAVLAVLAAAAQPAVQYVALIVPERYKGSNTASAVERDVTALAMSAGVSLALRGALVLAYRGGR